LTLKLQSLEPNKKNLKLKLKKMPPRPRQKLTLEKRKHLKLKEERPRKPLKKLKLPTKENWNQELTPPPKLEPP